MTGPDPRKKFPVKNSKIVVYLKNIVKSPCIEVGDYSYYADPVHPERFEQNVLYLNSRYKDRLVIGKFCAIARGVKFIMNAGNHKTEGFSTYPFHLFGFGWESSEPPVEAAPYKGDTVLENDVWVGYKALIMPGVRIGNGAIIASRAVVTGNIPPYAVAAGNPARIVRKRFPDETVERLQKIAWWNWPADKISRNLDAITGSDLEKLENCR